jgi:hypothetical protein
LLKQLHKREYERFQKEPDAARNYLHVGDRPPAEGLDSVELAAAAVVASTILNLDASLMTR